MVQVNHSYILDSLETEIPLPVVNIKISRTSKMKNQKTKIQWSHNHILVSWMSHIRVENS